MILKSPKKKKMSFFFQLLSYYMTIGSNRSKNLFLSLYCKHFLINEKYLSIRTKPIIYPQVKPVKYELSTGVPHSWSKK